MAKKKLARFEIPFLYKLVILSIIIFSAAWLSQTHYPKSVIEALLPYKMLTALVIGIFYTSFLTIPFALIGFYVLSTHMDPLPLALLGGLGSTLGDLIIVNLLRRFVSFLSLNLHIKKRSYLFIELKRVLKEWNLNFFAIVVGAVIVASPFPDEIGLTLLGFSNLSYTKMMLLVFVLNTIGILIIVSPAYLFL